MTLRASLSILGYATASEMESTLTSTLVAAVDDGSFDDALQGVVTMTWRDQGWGNQKGMVSVVETLPSDPTEGGPGTPSDTPEARRDHKPSGMPWGPCVVAGREPAPHADETLRLSFPIKRGATYALWYRVGAGVATA